jgi:excisionase family DNA binding protein
LSIAPYNGFGSQELVTAKARRKTGEAPANAGKDFESSYGFAQIPGATAVSGEEFNMADAREVMNIRQASHYLGVSPDTLYKYVSEERIPAFKLGNRWKFKKSILDTWMENQSFNSDLPRPRKLTRVRAEVS